MSCLAILCRDRQLPAAFSFPAPSPCEAYPPLCCGAISPRAFDSGDGQQLSMFGLRVKVFIRFVLSYNEAITKCLAAVLVLQRKCQQFQGVAPFAAAPVPQHRTPAALGPPATPSCHDGVRPPQGWSKVVLPVHRRRSVPAKVFSSQPGELWKRLTNSNPTPPPLPSTLSLPLTPAPVPRPPSSIAPVPARLPSLLMLAFRHSLCDNVTAGKIE